MLLVRDVLRFDAIPIVTLGEHEAVESAAALMHFAGLPALVLVDRHGCASALLTARDLVDFFARDRADGASGLPSIAASNGGPQRCSSCSSLSKVVDRMADHDLQAVLVVDDGSEIGLLTVESVAAALSRVGN